MKFSTLKHLLLVFIPIYLVAYYLWVKKDSYQSIRLLFDILITMVIAATFSWHYLISPLFQQNPISPLFIFISVAYPIAVLIGAGGIYAEGKINYLRLFLPYFSLIILFTVMLYHAPQISSIAIGSGIALVLMIVRQIITQLDNYHLLQNLHSFMEQLEQKVQKRTEQLKKKNQQLTDALIRVEYLAYHDTLTGLPNRRLFAERLQNAISIAEKNQQLLAVLFLDLDRFKIINDSWGHAVGDLLLKKMAIRLSSYLQQDNTVCRLAGDEFIILLRNVPSLQGVVKIVQDLLKLVAQPFSLDNKIFYLSCSIGITIYPYDGNDGDTLIRYADMAMSRAKELGKNNYQFFTSDLDSFISRKLLIENGLRKALKNQEFTVYYQPQVNLKTGEMVGVEALIRWQSPELGAVSPGEFIPVAEETGIIMEIGEWILRTAYLQIKTWEKQGYPVLRIGVNLSPRQFQQDNLVQNIASLLAENHLSPQQLDLEITESMAMYNVEVVISKLKALKKLGVHLSLDDFGTGYSSLSYLSKMPIDTLKIAQMFVQQITDNPDDTPIVKAIIVMARSLHLHVLAEGVEKLEQAEYLTELECNEAQGYLFSKPLPASELEKLLEQASLPHTITKNEYTN